MADRAFREMQWARRFDPHIAPINLLVDTLAGGDRGWLPYVAPMYGGTGARLLSLLRDPGPRTQTDTGSGFLSMENDDPTAEALCGHFAAAGILATEVVPWNAYPWYINRAPCAAELTAGLEPLRQLLDLLPHLRVVMLHGGSAQAAWRKFQRAHPGLIESRQLEVLPTYHTSRQAFWHADPMVRQQRREDLTEAFSRARRLLDSAPHPASAG